MKKHRPLHFFTLVLCAVLYVQNEPTSPTPRGANSALQAMPTTLFCFLSNFVLFCFLSFFWNGMDSSQCISFSVFLLHVEIPVVVTATFGFRNHALMALNADIKETEAGSSVLHNL